MDRNIESMFDDADQTINDYRALQDDFGGNAVVVLVYRDDDIESTEAFDRNRQVSESISLIPGV